MSVNEKMTALADAVRSKSNMTGTLTIDAMTQLVRSLDVGGGGGGGGGEVPSTQSLTVTPTKSTQTFLSSDLGSNTYYSVVTVNAIPSEYITTTDATASTYDILEGETAYVNGEKVTGSIKNYGDVTETFSNASDLLSIKANGYFNTIKVNLTRKTLEVTPTKSTQTLRASSEGSDVFYTQVNVAPIPEEYITTADATATAGTILEGKTAYVKGEKVTGTYIEVSEDDVRIGVNFGANNTFGGEKTGRFTLDATAEAEDIAPGKTAYAFGIKLTGAMPSKEAETYTPGTADITIKSGVYLAEDQTIKGDGNLTAENIKAGVSIFNVDGTFTSDADAADADIAEGKTAYVNGVKVVGTATGGGVNRLWIYKDGIITSPVASDLGNSSIQVPSRPGDMTFYVAADGMIIYKHDFDFNNISRCKVRPVTGAEGWTIALAWNGCSRGVSVKDGIIYAITSTYEDSDRRIVRMTDSPVNVIEAGHFHYDDMGGFVLTQGGDAYYVNPDYPGSCNPIKIDIKISKLLNQCPIDDYDYPVRQPAIDTNGRIVLLNGGRADEHDVSVTVLADKVGGSPFVNYYHYFYEDYGEGGGAYSFAVNNNGTLFCRNASSGTIEAVQNIPSVRQDKFLGYCRTDVEYTWSEDEGDVWIPSPSTVALCIATNGTLWKLTADCTSSGQLTGVSAEQVGEDADWQYAPPCLNKGRSGFAQKGSKLYRLHLNNDLSTRLEEFYPSPTGKLISVSWDDKCLWFDTEDKDVTSCGVLK